MTAERVETAIEVISRRDPELGRWAQWAADSLTAGAGEEIISQASLQSYLWYYLPKKSDEDSWVRVAEGAAALLDELGLDRYAAIARSDVTANILAAWRESPGIGFGRYKSSMIASGVEPPDTDLLAWGQIMGTAEVSVLAHVECALEAAIVAGALMPAAKGSKQMAREVCMRAIQEPIPEVPTQSWLTLVITERVEQWVDARRSERLRSWRASIANSVLNAPEPPEDLDRVIASMSWLLEACREGVELTQAGYLPPRLVREAIDRFFASETVGHPRSEVDVHQLSTLREAASRIGALTKRRRLLKTSTAGLRLLREPVAMWRAIAANLDEGDEYSKMLSELIALRLLQGPAVGVRALKNALAPIILEQGWRARGVPITERDVEGSVHRPLWFWRLFGLLDEQHPRWEAGRSVGEYVTALTPTGRATAMALLHARATAPRPRA